MDYDLCDHCLEYQQYNEATMEDERGTPLCQLCHEEAVFNAI